MHLLKVVHLKKILSSIFLFFYPHVDPFFQLLSHQIAQVGEIGLDVGFH